jgi:Uma2 family endonuclease
MSAPRQYTIEDLEAVRDDGHVWELIDGVLVRRAPVGGLQGVVQANVTGHVWTYVHPHQLGAVLVAGTIYVLGRQPDTGLKPDVSFISRDRLPADEALVRPPEIAPDLVVEVVGPNDPAGEIEDKVARYRRFGVPLIWVLWLSHRSIFIFSMDEPTRELHEGDELDGGHVLPGFRVAVADLFRVGR